MGSDSSKNAAADNAGGASAFDQQKQPHYLGLINLGNSCYLNSVLQALYHCPPARQQIIQHQHDGNTLLSAMGDLFAQLESRKKKQGSLAPRKFFSKLKADNEMFNSGAQQDAHEFLLFLLNEATELLDKEKSKEKDAAAEGGKGHQDDSGDESSPERGPKGGKKPRGFPLSPCGAAAARKGRAKQRQREKERERERQKAQEGVVGVKGEGEEEGDGPQPTWIRKLFEGLFVNETTCLGCRNVTAMRERFVDVSVEVRHNESVYSRLQNFSSVEKLEGESKYMCDFCKKLQDAERRQKIAVFPPVLFLHLKRFKFSEREGQLIRLHHRAPFTLEMRLAPDHLTPTAKTIQTGGGAARKESETGKDKENEKEKEGNEGEEPSAPAGKEKGEGTKRDSKNETDKQLRRRESPTLPGHVIPPSPPSPSGSPAPSVSPVVPVPSEIGGRDGRGRAQQSFEDSTLYSLVAVVVHVGQDMSRGHYVSLVRCEDSWACLDDDEVREVTPEALGALYGSSARMEATKCGYLLMYMASDADNEPDF
uniref:Ubiquitin carboxyl-terminal hydrolase n=1 Tax=Chromera velia CCMP2878 TaxID=1169474 RepID=A0A0G4FV88_9ALVE|eukprot:Cvel_486.t1-p1 / transcript=Cvel_486.t1 / gene=Cvel_486 / organism=Chromera_velia_CCMP2878 / gene_product=Ubiquitin carboxyl-terminal hydrolase 4, putative / transcript_product=Ubiquitin carboxyl-terminal hydrolase 4, putative / location=Cvel_scaffold15:97474-105293(-) / protein_length=536 / sequence_SO=supercontig / SO=protein_coding / is_pseudo=false